MVAYSFKRQFILPIRLGLGLPVDQMGAIYPKRQTIRAERAGKSRHAVPGEEMQLYFGMRTKACQLIGMARCIAADPVTIMLAKNGYVQIGRGLYRRGNELDVFARCDGFVSWAEMRKFWRQTHPDLDVFRGVLLKWEQPHDRQA